MIYKIIWEKEYKLYIWNDEDSLSPRDKDNLWTILCDYKKYNLWDEQFNSSYWELMENNFAIHINKKYDICDIDDYYNLTTKEFNKIWQWIEKNIFYDILSFTNYSDINLYIGHPKDKWNSWYIWYIYCHKDKIREDFNIKYISEVFKNKTYDIFKWEIETYNQYLSWEIYEYIFEEREVKIIDWKEFYTERENIDSCWWFYSLNDIVDYIDKDIFTKDDIINYTL